MRDVRDAPRRCWKRRFSSEYDAQRALDRIIDRSTRTHVPTRVYDCPYCEGWHLTSREPSPLRRTAPAQPGPRRPRLTGPTDEVRALVLARDDYRCVRCGQSVLGQPYSLQHRRARGIGGTRRPDTNGAANLLTACGTATSAGGCHTWMESHPIAAGELGYRIAQRANPTDRPVWIHDRGWVLLDDHGGRHPVAAPHNAA